MPIPIKNLKHDSLETRLEQFRHTIPIGQGYEIDELVDHAQIGGSYAHVSKTIRENNWGLKIINGRNRIAIILVNPKDLPKHAHPAKTKTAR